MTYDPYATSFPAPAVELSLAGLGSDGSLPRTAYASEGNQSPAIRWGDMPPGTASVMVTAFDPDSPIPGGFWHWLAKDIPGGAGGLPAGAGASDDTLPGAGVHIAGSMGDLRYAGVNPPPGTGVHRLFVCVTALDVPTLDVPADAGPARLLIAAIPHTLGRGIAIGTSQAPPAS
jgi:Raf kinase inhibitor-like YbhB/YbcL family protein